MLAGLTADQVSHRPTATANPIGWLIWHLTRVQDDHLARAAAREQVWNSDGFVEAFDLPYDADDIGFGHESDDVAAFDASTEQLLAYHRAVRAASVVWLASLRDEDLTRVVDENWDPPVTLAVRLVSVVDECAQHVGQAAYLKGLLTA